jgi:hypothetical protein
MRASTVWLALHPADCCACANSTCSWRINMPRSGSNSSANALRASDWTTAAAPATWTIALCSEILPSSEDVALTTPSRPTIAVSIRSPTFIATTSEMTPV